MQSQINGEILGFAGILINIDIVEIMNIVVRKKYRKQGIGQKLLKELVKIAQKTNVEFINLEVNVKNKPAIKLYEKYSFEQIGVRKKYYNMLDDALIMQKRLK